MKRRELLALGFAFIVMVGGVYAADKQDPNGTWKWSSTFGDRKIDFTLKLKLEGDKLSGTLAGGRDNTETKIEDGTFKDNEVAFSVTREFNGNKRTSKYKGKVDGDTLKGKIEFKNRDGQDQSRDFEAKREKA